MSAGAVASVSGVMPEAVSRAQRALGVGVLAWGRPERTGYSVNEHWLIQLDDGRRAFLKCAAPVDRNVRWLRGERRTYGAIRGSFMPELLAWDDDDERPMLVLEDVASGAPPPPPPWRDGDVGRVLDALSAVATAVPTAPLPSIAERRLPGWDAVLCDPTPFLGIGIADRTWLRVSGPVLAESALAAPLAGEAVVHGDVRSDNLILSDDRVVLFDWDHAGRGNAVFDVAMWLPSLCLEGGPPPIAVTTTMPGVDAFAAYVAGFFAAEAGRPPPPGAPGVRDFQRRQLAVALDWTCAVLDLPSPCAPLPR